MESGWGTEIRKIIFYLTIYAESSLMQWLIFRSGLVLGLWKLYRMTHKKMGTFENPNKN